MHKGQPAKIVRARVVPLVARGELLLLQPAVITALTIRKCDTAGQPRGVRARETAQKKRLNKTHLHIATT